MLRKAKKSAADKLYGDVLIPMDPGSTYLVWTWAWGSGYMRAEEECGLLQ